MTGERVVVAYVAGPYRDKSEWKVVNNIRTAENLALSLWRPGVAVICPHKNTAFFGGAQPDEVWLDGDLELVRRSDVVVCTADWERSLGARNEVQFASELGIPVLHSVHEFDLWFESQQFISEN